MNVEVKTKQRINRPVAAAFDALVDHRKMMQYFMDHSTGPLVAGTTVRWSWGEIASDTVVEQVVTDELIVCRWEAHNVEYQTTCRFEFASNEDDSTTVTIHEQGWKDDQAGLDSALEHAQGWTHMLLCLKAWIEHGIDLRT